MYYNFFLNIWFEYRLINYSEVINKADDVSLESKNSAGMLTSLALTNNMDLPVYETVSTTGPAHNRRFVMTCKMKQHTTQGYLIFVYITLLIYNNTLSDL